MDSYGKGRVLRAITDSCVCLQARSRRFPTSIEPLAEPDNGPLGPPQPMATWAHGNRPRPGLPGAAPPSSDDAGAVCDDDELHAVAGIELGLDARDVRLDGGLPDEQARGYLGVGGALRHELQDL